MYPIGFCLLESIYGTVHVYGFILPQPQMVATECMLFYIDAYVFNDAKLNNLCIFYIALETERQPTRATSRNVADVN